MVTRKVIFVFFVLQMVQIPLIWMARVLQLKKRPLLANVYFWISIMSGLPLITILYTRDYVLTHKV